MAWLFARVSEASSWDSDSPSEITAPFVTLSGKPTQRPLSWRGWKSRPWIRLLYGMISKPSTAARGVESWISSQRATRASRFPTPASAEATPTSATCGPMSLVSCLRYPPAGVSSRTSAGIYLSASRRSFLTWSEWTTALRQVCSERPTWAHRIGASGCSSWQTATAREHKGAGNLNRGKCILSEEAENNWPTPKAIDTPEREKHKDGQEIQLPMVASRWLTPKTPTGGGQAVRPSPGSLRKLEDQILSHPAPPRTGAVWPTPRVGMERCDSATYSRGKGNIEEEVSAFMERQSPATSGRRSLNPRFVEWLMGLPLGWTACERAGMPSYPMWRLSALSRLRECLNTATRSPGK